MNTDEQLAVEEYMHMTRKVPGQTLHGRIEWLLGSWRRWAIIGLCLLIIGLGLGWWGGQYDLPREYYRGGYDVCFVLGPPFFPFASDEELRGICLEAMGWELEGDWYGQPSPGWRWPLP